jgi:hypothetical protein
VGGGGGQIYEQEYNRLRLEWLDQKTRLESGVGPADPAGPGMLIAGSPGPAARRASCGGAGGGGAGGACAGGGGGGGGGAGGAGGREGKFVGVDPWFCIVVDALWLDQRGFRLFEIFSAVLPDGTCRAREWYRCAPGPPPPRARARRRAQGGAMGERMRAGGGAGGDESARRLIPRTLAGARLAPVAARSTAVWARRLRRRAAVHAACA